MIRKSDFWEMFAAVVCLFAFCTLSSSQNLTVASYNIRYENDGDYNRGNGWDARYPWICSFIRFEDPDIFGSQEVLKDQLSDMQSLLPSYSVVGVGRDDGVDEGGLVSGLHSALQDSRKHCFTLKKCRCRCWILPKFVTFL